ncbi:MAG: CDP-alcohol phosphatidyltransferase family protein [Treponemataceae bacterium]
MDTYYDPDRPKTYSYKGENRSIADKYVLKHWWPIALKAIPAKAPANLVSMVGNLGSYLAFFIASGLLLGPVSVIGREKPWIFGVIAFGLFFYQTLDALDGIQARRTGASGPLGEFVDHWFDSFNVFLVPLGIVIAFPVIPWQVMVPCQLIYTTTNWILIRALNNTQVLVFDKFSTEEGQIAAQLFYLSVWILGYDFWAKPLVFGVPPIWIGYALLPLGMLFTAVRSYKDSRGFGLLSIAIASLLPLSAWVFLAVPRVGETAIIMGGLTLGFSGSRYVGQLIQDRLIGRVYNPYLPDIAGGGIALCAIALIPGLPDWSIIVSGSFMFIWTIVALASQFNVTLSRIRKILGRGLFWPLTGSKLDSEAGRR